MRRTDLKLNFSYGMILEVCVFAAKLQRRTIQMNTQDETQFKALCDIMFHHVNQDGSFPSHARCRMISLTPEGVAVGELDVLPEVLNVWGIVHGGALATLADTISGCGAVAATGWGSVTVSYSMNFLRPATGTKITCTARPVKLGKHLCVMRAELTNDRGELVADSELTFSLTAPLEELAP